MQNIPVVTSPDGYDRADRTFFQGTQVHAKTAAYTILASERGRCFSNKGATGTVQLTAPPPVEGFWFIMIQSAAQVFELLPNGTEKINGGSTKASSPNTQNNIAAAIFMCAEGQWRLISQGTWTIS